MGKINVLGFDIANLIAAGEVVERPSSVLKELIENSIDAGATKIVAEIKRGGVALIRVTDNGCGIEKDDLPVALKRHATSKIATKEDLDGITTLGFRGEALAAISSVSCVTIITKTALAESGYMLVSEGGNIVDISEVGAAEGTTVVVENLFFNVPARRKFLKKDSTEAMNVTALVEKVALSRPDISIQLLIDGEERFNTPGDGKLINTISSIYGRDFSKKLIEVKGQSEGIAVSGYVGRSDNVRKNRNLENIFINGRYVKSLTAQAAVEKAFTSYIAPECFPCAIIFIEINPAMVDVNVHPAKLEVKFSDERRVFEAVYYSVKEAVTNYEYRPEMTLGTKKPAPNLRGAFMPIGENETREQMMFSSDVKPPEPTRYAEQFSRSSSSDFDALTANASRALDNLTGEKASISAPSAVRYEHDIDKPLRVSSPHPAQPPKTSDSAMTPARSLEILKKYENTSPSASAQSAQAAEEQLSDIEYKYIGEAFETYLIIEYKGELMLIDKHAAHERVIFEDLLKIEHENGKVASQSLLLPLTVILPTEELSQVKENREELVAVGYEFNINERSVDITAIPNAISANDAEGLFSNMVHELSLGLANPEINNALRREKALYQIACKAAIKGGRVYDRSITDWLIKKLLGLPDITVCPHGRPVAYKLKKSEIDRQFDRIK